MWHVKKKKEPINQKPRTSRLADDLDIRIISQGH